MWVKIVDYADIETTIQKMNGEGFSLAAVSNAGLNKSGLWRLTFLPHSAFKEKVEDENHRHTRCLNKKHIIEDEILKAKNDGFTLDMTSIDGSDTNYVFLDFFKQHDLKDLIKNYSNFEENKNVYPEDIRK